MSAHTKMTRSLKRALTREYAEYLSRVIACLLIVIIPALHIACLYYFWHEYSREVDKRRCTCSCWDTVFKGPYESNVASFKHVYFNATSNSWKIWTWTVISFISFYECIKRLFILAWDNNLRLSMASLFISSVFSNYYSWWGYVNYWNDEFYSEWYHQLFFTITELISTSLVFNQANLKTPVSSRKLGVVVAIALIHSIVACVDQFITNVIRGQGMFHQVLRDLWLMIPDLFHVVIPLFMFRRSSRDAF